MIIATRLSAAAAASAAVKVKISAIEMEQLEDSGKLFMQLTRHETYSRLRSVFIVLEMEFCGKEYF